MTTPASLAIAPGITGVMPAVGVEPEQIKADVLNVLSSVGFDVTPMEDGTTPHDQFADAMAQLLTKLLTQYAEAVAQGVYAGMVLLQDVPNPSPPHNSLAHL